MRGGTLIATYVIVPGGYSGGWQWRAVAKNLRAAGHEVFTPTLTGLGERVHLAHPEIDLDTHIEDIVNIIRYEDLSSVILVGYSYSGMVVTGVADRIPERIAHLVFVDAYVPEDGQSVADLLGPQVMETFLAVVQQHGDGWRIPHDPTDHPFATPHPVKTGLQPVRLQHPDALALPRTFIYCTEEKDPPEPVLVPIVQAAARVKADPSWRYYELPTGHLPWETMSDELAAILEEVAERQRDATA